MSDVQRSSSRWHSARLRLKQDADLRTLLLLCSGLAIVTFAVYARTAANEFIMADDGVYIYKNGVVARGLTLEGVKWVFTRELSGHWHSLTWVSHMLDVELFGMNAGAHHLVNVALHALSSSLLLLLLYRMTGSLWCSALVAALFAIHPQRVESVAWASERKDVLSGLFWMITLLAYERYARQQGLFRNILVACCFLLGLLSKSMLVTLPCVLLLLDFWPLHRLRGALGAKAEAASVQSRYAPRTPLSLFLEKLPLFCLAFLVSKLTIGAQADTLATFPLSVLSLSARLSNAVTSYAMYLWKFLYPNDLTIFYPHPAIVSPETYDPWNRSFFVAALVVAAITLVVLRSWKRRPYLALGWFWYLGTLVPVIGIAQVGWQSSADRYTYLPMIGIFIMIAWGLRDLVASWPRTQPFVVGGACAAMIAFSWLTWVQIGYWKNSETLFMRAIDVTEGNFFAHTSLGMVFQRRGATQDASYHAEKAVRIYPSYAPAQQLLGTELGKQGKYERSIEHMKEAVRLVPDNVEYQCSLGWAYHRSGDLTRAIETFEQAIVSDPDYPKAHFLLGTSWMSRKEWGRAYLEFERALKLSPTYVEAAFGIGSASFYLGRFSDAIRAYQWTIELNPNFNNAYCALGMSYESLGEDAQATSAYETALQQNGNCKPAILWSEKRPR